MAAVLLAGAHPGHPGPPEEEPPPVRGAYAAVDVASAGRLEGRVLALDPPPPFGDHPVTGDEKACGKRIPDERILIGPQGQVGNAVVSLEGIEAGKPIQISRRPALVNARCRFRPHVLSVSVGQKLEIVNGDPVLHNTHAKMDGVRTVFEVSLPVQNQKIPRLIREPGIMKVECDAGHEWMSAWILAFSHPYHAVTGEDGRFVIDQIPPGTYRVKAWHEELGSQVLETEIPPDGTAVLTFRALAR